MKKWMLALLPVLFLVACQSGSDGGGGGGGTTPAATTDTTASTPLSTTCLDGTTYCNNNIYGTSGYAFIPYPGYYSYAFNYTTHINQYGGFCNCPQGYLPVYNNTYGLGCVRQTYMTPYSGFFLTWKWGSSTTWEYGTINNGNTGYAGINGGIQITINGGYNPYRYNRGYRSYPTYGSYGSAPQYSNNHPQYSNIPGASGGPNYNCSKNLAQSCLLNQANTCGATATCRPVLQGSALGVCVSNTH